jgi:flagellar L-ring protein precursor FlgH
MNRRLKLSHSVAASVLLLAGGCANTVDRIAQIGEAPAMAAVANPVEKPDYRPVTTPLPAPDVAPKMANSLWRPGAKAFFRDQRAARVGDILTVNVQIADEANVNNTTTRARTAEETMGMPGLFGLETQLGKVLPEGVDPTNLVGINGGGNFAGEGAVQREETVNLTIAAMVVQVLPNGNLVISGRQEVRVNFEVRELTVAGIVRPEDISATNVVSHTQIAEARISYGGRGQITDVQQPRYGQQLLDIIAPF